MPLLGATGDLLRRQGATVDFDFIQEPLERRDPGFIGSQPHPHVSQERHGFADPPGPIDPAVHVQSQRVVGLGDRNVVLSLYEAKLYKEAADLAESYLKKDPKDKEVTSVLVGSYEALKVDDTMRRSAISKLLALDPTAENFWLPKEHVRQ